MLSPTGGRGWLGGQSLCDLVPVEIPRCARDDILASPFFRRSGLDSFVVM